MFRITFHFVMFTFSCALLLPICSLLLLLSLSLPLLCTFMPFRNSAPTISLLKWLYNLCFFPNGLYSGKLISETKFPCPTMNKRLHMTCHQMNWETHWKALAVQWHSLCHEVGDSHIMVSHPWFVKSSPPETNKQLELSRRVCIKHIQSSVHPIPVINTLGFSCNLITGIVILAC